MIETPLSISPRQLFFLAYLNGKSEILLVPPLFFSHQGIWQRRSWLFFPSSICWPEGGLSL